MNFKGKVALVFLGIVAFAVFGWNQYVSKETAPAAEVKRQLPEGYLEPSATWKANWARRESMLQEISRQETAIRKLSQYVELERTRDEYTGLSNRLVLEIPCYYEWQSEQQAWVPIAPAKERRRHCAGTVPPSASASLAPQPATEPAPAKQ